MNILKSEAADTFKKFTFTFCSTFSPQHEYKDRSAMVDIRSYTVKRLTEHRSPANYPFGTILKLSLHNEQSLKVT